MCLPFSVPKAASMCWLNVIFWILLELLMASWQGNNKAIHGSSAMPCMQLLSWYAPHIKISEMYLSSVQHQKSIASSITSLSKYLLSVKQLFILVLYHGWILMTQNSWLMEWALRTNHYSSITGNVVCFLIYKVF